MTFPVDADERYPVLDCLISRTDMPRAARSISERIRSEQGGYVCFSNVHTVVTARRDLRLRQATNDSFLSVPDGKPLSIVAKMQGIRDIGQVAGPDFMPYLIKTGGNTRHFFYGSTPATLEKLQANLARQFPEAKLVGGYSPPFRTLSETESLEIVDIIKQACPDVVWVGLGAPRQEYWMAEHWQQLKPAVLLGVGAAFDFHAGQIARAPEWMKAWSVEWIHRLCQEPRRLWKRYLVTNSLFIYYLMKNMLVRHKVQVKN